MPEKDELLLRHAALRTWRYFAEFSTEEHNWLVPDNVQEEPPAIAARISPTNLGFLLNARQVACEFGYLTIPEFAQQTTRRLWPRCRSCNAIAAICSTGMTRDRSRHWHLNSSLPSTAATCWPRSGPLQQGCLDLLSRPVLQACAAEGFVDHLRILVDLRAFSPKRFSAFQKEIKRKDWLQYLLSFPDAGF